MPEAAKPQQPLEATKEVTSLGPLPDVEAVGTFALPDVEAIGTFLKPPTEFLPLYHRRGGISIARVSFYSSTGNFSITGEGGQARQGRTPFSGDILDIQTNKDLGGPAGVFTIVLHDRATTAEGPFKGRYLADLVGPHDIVVIEMGHRDPFVAGGELTAVMIGLVGQAPREVEALEGETPTHRVVITGFDFGKFFLNAQMQFFRDVPTVDLKVFASQGLVYLDNGAFPGGTKAEVIAYALQTVFYKIVAVNYQLEAPPALPETNFKGLLGYRLGDTYGELFTGTNIFSVEENMWSLLESISEPTWCELVVDCWPDDLAFERAMVPAALKGPERPRPFGGMRNYLMLRQAPFGSDDWNTLPSYTITDDNIFSSDIGGEPTIFNLFYARAKAFIGTEVNSISVARNPIFNKESYLKYGYRPLIVESQVFPLEGNINGDAVQEVSKKLSELLYQWYAPSADFQSGTMVLQGNAKYKVGTRLNRVYLNRLRDGSKAVKEFYLEGVAHSWTAFDTWKTTTRVTRGLYKGSNRFPDIPDDAVRQNVTAGNDTTYPFRH